MKKLSIISFAFAIAVGGTTFTSCGKKEATKEEIAEKKVQDDELKAFMLGGIYFEYTYGGKSETEKYVNQFGTDEETLLKTYREVFVFPYKPEEASQIKPVLDDMWGISDKKSFTEMADGLKKHTLESSHSLGLCTFGERNFNVLFSWIHYQRRSQQNHQRNFTTCQSRI